MGIISNLLTPLAIVFETENDSKDWEHARVTSKCTQVCMNRLVTCSRAVVYWQGFDSHIVQFSKVMVVSSMSRSGRTQRNHACSSGKGLDSTQHKLTLLLVSCIEHRTTLYLDRSLVQSARVDNRNELCKVRTVYVRDLGVKKGSSRKLQKYVELHHKNIGVGKESG